MSHEIICDWLLLPAKTWPPDHYTLLGLPPGEADPERIERQVHQRLKVVRGYQLTHPEQATEAMNHLARAFVCLTDPAAKRAYDAGLLGEPPPAPAATAVAEEKEPEAPVPPAATPPEAAAGPAPSANHTPFPPVAALAEAGPPPVVLLDSSVAVPAAPPAAPPVDPVVEAARSAPAARRGLGTKRALYRRLARTRRLARAWELAGKYLAWPKRRLTRPAEAKELTAVLALTSEALEDFPPLLGEAGQPGYLALTLARQPAVVPTFQALLASQREALARDWWAGRTFLQAHREFLRQELRTLRRKGLWFRGVRALRSFLSDHPAGMFILLALLALTVVLWWIILMPDWWPA
jgi:hypothetical protein